MFLKKPFRTPPSRSPFSRLSVATPTTTPRSTSRLHEHSHQNNAVGASNAARSLHRRPRWATSGYRHSDDASGLEHLRPLPLLFFVRRPQPPSPYRQCLRCSLLSAWCRRATAPSGEHSRRAFIPHGGVSLQQFGSTRAWWNRWCPTTAGTKARTAAGFGRNRYCWRRRCSCSRCCGRRRGTSSPKLAQAHHGGKQAM